MKDHGSRLVSMRRIKAPGDIKKRMQQPHVIELAESMREVGPIHDMVCRQKDMKLIAGRDRYAAHVINETEKVWVKLVDCTDHEMRTLERHENIHRRHDTGERMRLMAELVEKEAATIAKEEGIPLDGCGRRKTAKGVARERVAKQFRTTVSNVRSAEYRTAKKNPTPAEPKPPPVKPLGMRLEEAFIAKVTKVQETVDGAATAVSRALGDFTRLSGDFPEGKLQRIRSALQDASNLIRGHRPEALCPSCKAIEPIKASCAGCGGTGWVGKAQLAGVPEALLREEDPVVQVDGKLVPASSFFDPEATAAEELFG